VDWGHLQLRKRANVVGVWFAMDGLARAVEALMVSTRALGVTVFSGQKMTCSG
jgi:hypothetical protein